MSFAEKVFRAGLDIYGHLHSQRMHGKCEHAPDIGKAVRALHLSYAEADLVADTNALIKADIKRTEVTCLYETLLCAVEASCRPNSEIEDEGRGSLFTPNESHPLDNGSQIASTLASWHKDKISEQKKLAHFRR